MAINNYQDIMNYAFRHTRASNFFLKISQTFCIKLLRLLLYVIIFFFFFTITLIKIFQFFIDSHNEFSSHKTNQMLCSQIFINPKLNLKYYIVDIIYVCYICLNYVMLLSHVLLISPV